MNRLPGLDLLRAVAIVWVMYSHAQSLGVRPEGDVVARFGWMGVDLFFALSGFLIGGQLFRSVAGGHAADPGAFYARRLLRTLPAYLAVVAFYFLLPGFREQPQIQPLWQFLTFTENLFINVDHPKSFSHVWSLCVEEQFYLIAPVAVWLLARRPLGWKAAAVAAALVVGGMVLRGWIWRHDLAPLHASGVDSPLFWHLWIERIYYPTWTRLDGLIAGAAFAFVAVFHPDLWERLTRRANLLLCVGLIGVGASIWLFWGQADFLPTVIGYPLLALSMALLVAAGATATSLIGRWAVPGAGLLAAISYSLYLTHKAVIQLVKHLAAPLIDGRPLLAVVVYVGAILAAGGLLYLVVERPFLRLRDRLLAARRARAEAAVVEVVTA